MTNSSLENQQQLVTQLIASLNYYSEIFESMVERYQKYISVLEDNGLVRESINNLQDNYFENTKAMLLGLVEHIQKVDVQDARRAFEQLENLKNSANK